MNWKTALLAWVCTLAVFCALPNRAHAAGTLKDATSGEYAQIVDHQVRVVLNNGFAKTEVTQVFENPSAGPIDAIYEFPIPQDAALSEMTIVLADRVMHGEVLPREQAESIYNKENAAGNQAGLATKDGHQNFRFSVANIPAKSQATMSFVYYEPLAIDESIGRYLYPLQDGGTAQTFWNGQQTVSGTFRFDLELKSALPIEDVRMPGQNPAVEQLGEGHYKISLETAPANLGQDLVFYYKFPSDLPGRLEVVPYRAAAGGQGTFMAVLTPGLELAPITHGSDYVFVLDRSGSMESKIAALIDAVVQSLNKLGPDDRFRIIAFDDQVIDVSGGWFDASAANIAAAAGQVEQLVPGGGTDVYAGLSEGLSGLDPDRVVSTFLVTDAETNTGIVDPIAFDQLARRSDVRVYGLLMSNNANWPLMEIIAEASGGFYAQVSNRDDILGQVQLAFNKAKHEALHDVKLDVSGAGVTETTDFRLSKIYQGQQLVIFGRYDQPGLVTLDLHAKASGQPKLISQSADLPATDVENAELERLWALDMIHAIEKQNLLGLISDSDAKQRIVKLGVDYQLVTDYTAMIVVDDATFEKYGVERLNENRVDAENGSGSYGGPSVSGGSGGAIDTLTLGLSALLALGLGALGLQEKRRRRQGR